MYSCAETWDYLREKADAVSWWKAVWFSVAIPCHAFILWLVFRDALITKEKMCKWGFNENYLCSFCRGKIESRDHLFFGYSLSSRIWRSLMADCLVSKSLVDWDDAA